MEKYEITATRMIFDGRNFECPPTEEAALCVMAEAHQQHIWNETELVGVSKRGASRLNEFFAEHPKSDGWRITIKNIKYNPRLIDYSTGLGQ